MKNIIFIGCSSLAVGTLAAELAHASTTLGQVVMGIQHDLEEEISSLENEINYSIYAIRPERIGIPKVKYFFSRKKKKNFLNPIISHRNSLIAKNLGRKIPYHIRQPRSRSQYQYRRPVMES
ncbi:MAG: hypothetical protein MRY57_03185 [Candidatus Pacebacteria bacterium]|nr:hypothetical protein [Candidatus Paceibacterota bacterium]